MKKIKKYILLIGCFLAVVLPVSANGVIAGKVTDTNGIPLSGVWVRPLGEKAGTLTNKDGEFSVSVGSFPVTLEYTYLGYEKNTLTYQTAQADEVVFIEKEPKYESVAYGVQSKELVTASVYSISGEELVSGRSTNLFTALQGRLPGLSIIQKDGEPGKESFSATIRGYDSPNSNRILYIVDGVERDPSGIDPYDVEKVTVLKDGAATAIYGMRGSGGILIIDTKKGFDGKSKISVSVDHALQSPTRKPKMVSAYDYALMYNQRVANDTLFSDAQDIATGGSGLDHSGTVFYTPYEIERYQKGDQTEFYPVRDMVDDFMKDFSQMTRINVNFRGGTDLMKYFTSVGYLNRDGLFENEPFDKYSYDAESKNSRFNFRTNMDIAINKTLDAWAKIGGYMERVNAPYVADDHSWDYVLAKLFETPNNAHNDLTHGGEVVVKRDKLNFRNASSVYGYLNRTGSISETVTRLGNTFGARQKLDRLTEGLSVTGQLTFDIFSRNTQIRSRSYEAWEVAALTDVNGLDSLGYVKVPGTSNSTLSDGQGKFFNYMYNMRVSVDYMRVFAGKHYVGGMLMGERYMQQQQSLLAGNYIGLAGRMTYAFSNRYLAEVNFAYQGSEQFAKGNRFGFFPSVSAAWLVSKEKFLENSKTISYLKLRASAGQTGNSAFTYGGSDQYLYLSTWNTDATEDQIGNPDIKWETSTKYNVGLEVEFFHSLNFGIDYFYHDNTDVIVKDIALIPDGMMGLGDATLPPANFGKTKNRGFELTAGYNKQFSKDVSLNLSGQVSFAKNEYIYMAELPYDETYAYPYRQKGYQINTNWGYQTDGLFNSQAEIDRWADQSALGGVPIPGDIKYLDLNKDGVIDPKDKAPLGRGESPDCIFGFRTQVIYKWFDLNVFVNGAAKRNVYLNGFGRWSNNDNFTGYMKNAWTPERYASGEKIDYPRLGNNTTNYTRSDYWIKDGSYIRLRNVELGFTFPQSISKKINANSIRLYVNGLNLFVWDKLPNDDFDPETSNSSNIEYPIMKAYNFGLSVKF